MKFRVNLWRAKLFIHWSEDGFNGHQNISGGPKLEGARDSGEEKRNGGLLYKQLSLEFLLISIPNIHLLNIDTDPILIHWGCF